MNTFTKMIIAGTLALSAATVSAAGSNIAGEVVNTSKTFRTQATMSQEAAYQLGLDTLRQIAGKSSLELSKALHGGVVDGSAEVIGAGHVRIAKQVNAGGAQEYVAMVSVPLSYKVVDSDR
jgi:hypothetical protein